MPKTLAGFCDTALKASIIEHPVNFFIFRIILHLGLLNCAAFMKLKNKPVKKKIKSSLKKTYLLFIVRHEESSSCNGVPMKIAKTITLMLIMFNCIALNATKESQPAWRSPTVEKKKKERNMANIFLAISNNNLNDLESLFHNNSHQDWQILLNHSFEGLTPLQKALTAKTISAHIVEALLENGANPNVGIEANMKDPRHNSINFYKGWTSCHIAVRLNAPKEILQLLMDRGGDFLQEDRGGWTPLALAIYHKRGNAKQFFSDSGLWRPKPDEKKLRAYQKDEPWVSKKKIETDSSIDGKTEDSSSEEFFSSDENELAPEEAQLLDNGIPVSEIVHRPESDLNVIYSFTNIFILIAVLYYGFYQS